MPQQPTWVATQAEIGAVMVRLSIAWHSLQSPSLNFEMAKRLAQNCHFWQSWMCWYVASRAQPASMQTSSLHADCMASGQPQRHLNKGSSGASAGLAATSLHANRNVFKCAQAAGAHRCLTSSSSWRPCTLSQPMRHPIPARCLQLLHGACTDSKRYCLLLHSLSCTSVFSTARLHWTAPAYCQHVAKAVDTSNVYSTCAAATHGD